MQQGNRCPNCRSPFKYGQSFCQACGILLSSGCPYCGTVISPGTSICPTCGALPGRGNIQQTNRNTPQPGWSKQPPRGWRQSGWTSPVTRSLPLSTRSLLLIVLLVLVVGLVSIIFWQFGTKSDKTLPVISAVSIAFRGKTSAQIIWQTSEPCSSQVEYGRTSQYGSLEPTVPQNDPTTGNSPGTTTHSINLKNLKSGYTYHYRVKSKDASGNEAVSNDFSFKTQETASFVVPD